MCKLMYFEECGRDLTIGFGNTLKFILLLDRIAVGGALGSVDQLVGKTLGDTLGVPKC